MTNEILRRQTRRHFFSDCGVGLGALALGQFLGGGQRLSAFGADEQGAVTKTPHFLPRAKSVIYLFMAGAPSQFELFDYKPELQRRDGETAPDSLFPKDKSFAFIGKGARLLGTRRKFAKHGECGMEVSELLPHTAAMADELCWIKGMKTDVFNHGPAKLFMNTGFQAPGRPSFGSWVVYGIGSEAEDLPGFVVLQSGPRGPREVMRCGPAVSCRPICRGFLSAEPAMPS